MIDFETPISLHVYNRPTETKFLLDVLKNIKPKYLFITCDGPKEGHEYLVNETKKLIENKIEWDCEIYKNYSESNKGSYLNNSHGLSWVFDHVEDAIILEDDCIPCESFFYYCQNLLKKYKYDERIALVSGNNFTGLHDYKYSYTFSRYGFIWGWATWSRVWKQIDFSMQEWGKFKKENGLRSRFDKYFPRKHWLEKIDLMYNNYIKYNDIYGQHWDRKLNMHMHMNNQLAVIPNENLVQNIGYGEYAANCKTKSKFHEFEIKDIELPLKHPRYVYPNVLIDDEHEKLRFSGGMKSLAKNKVLKKCPQGLKYLIKKLRD